MIKVGVLIGDFHALPNWQLRIINGILSDPDLELSLLMKDGRVGDANPNHAKNKISRTLRDKNVLGKIAFKVQSKIERKLFPHKSTMNKEEIIAKLNEIPLISLRPVRKGFLDIFSNEEADIIQQYSLDIILRHEFNIIRGPILNASTYGIWSFHHADNAINRGAPAGFWEVFLKQSSVGVTLQQLTPELDGGLIIDKAFFNRHWSFIQTNKRILEASVSVLFKNIARLKEGIYRPQKSPIYFNPLYRTPNLPSMLKYCFSFYKTLLSKAWEKISQTLFGTRYDCWSLFVGKGQFLESTLYRLKPIKPPKNEFWADPFLINYKGKTYVFFENYNYKTKVAKISCGLLDKNQLTSIEDVLVPDYHLSFPYVFEEDGDLFLMPESNDNYRLELYKCVEFPGKWELYSTAFERERVADAFFHYDDNNQKWLFINKQADLNTPLDSELFIYQVQGKGLEKLIPHKQNPVMINSQIARNGGTIFKYENHYYRPSQANIDGIYGRALNINIIEKLSLDDYQESKVVTVFPNFKKGLISTHHLHQTDDLFVIDAAYRKL